MNIKNHLILLATLLCIFPIMSNADELPDLGERSATILSAKMEKRLGKEFMREVRQRMLIVEDPIINDYIHALGKKLTAHTKKTNKKFHFFVVNDPTVNAFAGPGANIGINSGTILATASVSELAAIMAHEIAHVTQHHIELLLETIEHSKIAATLGIVAAILLGQSSDNQKNTTLFPDITNQNSYNKETSTTTTGIAATMGGITQHLINFTREQETAADYIGTKILIRAGFDPQAMKSVFERMRNQQYGATQDVPQQFLTHPKFDTRITATSNLSQTSKGIIPLQDTFDLIRIRTAVLTTRDLPKMIKNLRNKLKHQQNSVPLRYGYVLALYKNSQLIPALEIARKLYTEYPQEILLQMLAAQLMIHNKKTQALDILATAMTKHKNYYPLILQYAVTLLATGKPMAARDLLRATSITHPEDTTLYLLLAQAYAANKQLVEAYQLQADAYALNEHYRYAILLLQKALKIPNISTNNRAIINAKIVQFKTAEKNI